MEYKKIRELTTVVTGGTPSTAVEEYWSNGNIPWLQSGCCQNGDVFNTEKYITQAGYDNSSAQIMPKGTVMIALTGATAGKIGYLNFEACGNQSVTGILPCESINQRFLFYYLISRRKRILSDCVGGAQPHISQGYVKNVEVPMYSLKEQNRIAHIFDESQKLIEYKQLELKKLDELVKARFIEMFDSYLAYITLEEVTEKITDGSHNPPEGVEISQYMMLSSQNIFNDLNTDGCRYLYKEDFERENSRTDIKEGDVLVTIVGTIGRSHVVRKNEKYVFQRSVAVIKPTVEKINGTFLSYFLQTDKAKRQLDRSGHGTSQKGIYLSDLKQLNIPDVPINVQNKFADFVKQIDKSK